MVFMCSLNIDKYTWEIPTTWMMGLTEETRKSALLKVDELTREVKRTLFASPAQGITISDAKKSRALQRKQITVLNAVLENNDCFIVEKVRHPTDEIKAVYRKIILVASKKEKYQKILIQNLLSAYATFAITRKATSAENRYDNKAEAVFLKRVLTVILQTDRFNHEWSYLQTGLTVETTGAYNITASKIMTNLKIKVNEDAIKTLWQ